MGYGMASQERGPQESTFISSHPWAQAEEPPNLMSLLQGKTTWRKDCIQEAGTMHEPPKGQASRDKGLGKSQILSLQLVCSWYLCQWFPFLNRRPCAPGLEHEHFWCEPPWQLPNKEQVWQLGVEGTVLKSFVSHHWDKGVCDSTT